jgi:pimeloyl-ACP methyl ester carboxylesterase
LASFLEALEIEHVLVLGHSAGGPLALELAAQFPGLVRGLGLVAAPGVRPHRAVRKYKHRKRWSKLLHVPGIREILTIAIRRGFERAGFPTGLPGETLRQSIHIVAEFDFEATRENLDRIVCPTLVAWAMDDRFIDEEISRELATLAPEGPRLCFPEGGHYVQKHGAVEVCAALIAMVSAWPQEPS